MKLTLLPKVKDWFKALGIALVICWLVVNVLGKTSFVRESGMYPNLYSGDFIWVNKWSCGFVFPKHPLSIPGTSLEAKFLKIPYHRFGSIDTTLRNQIIAYVDPINPDKIRFGRLVGFSGETLDLENGVISINHQISNIKAPICQQYQVKIRSDFRGVIEDYNIQNPLPVSNLNDWLFNLYNEQLLAFQADPRIQHIRLNSKKKGERDLDIYPYNYNLRFNQDHWGPIYIPQENDSLLSNTTWDAILAQTLSIDMDSLNRLYAHHNADSLYEVSKIKTYNYYIVLSDNRAVGIDSRRLGLLREDHILGTVPFVFFSLNKQLGFKNKMKRIFTGL